MSDDGALFYLWLRDKPKSSTIRGTMIAKMREEVDAIDLLDRLCADINDELRPDQLRAAKKIRADFRAFRLKPRARKYMAQRFYMKHMISHDEAYRRFAAKSESTPVIKPLDWVAVYSALLGVSPP